VETLVDFEPSPFAPEVPALTALYWGEGAFTPPPEEVQQTRTLGSYRTGGLPAVVSHWYGFGTVLYPNLHFEVEEDSTRDWLLWDGFAEDGVTPLVDPESDWPFLAGLYDAVLQPRRAPVAHGDGTRFATMRASTDSAGDSLGDAQRADGILPTPDIAVPADGWYTVDTGKTLLLSGFGRLGSEQGSGFVDLVLRYSVGLAYTGHSVVQLTTDGDHWTDTVIQPSAADLAADATVDLGSLTLAELAQLAVRFTNDSDRPASVSFDVVRLRVQAWPRVYLPRLER
jgi:hypothetical protein